MTCSLSSYLLGGSCFTPTVQIYDKNLKNVTRRPFFY